MTVLIQKLRQQKSMPSALVYLTRYVLRRGPEALRRRLALRGDVAKLANRINGSNIRVGISVCGGVGDHIITARFVRDLRASTEPFNFDIFSPSPTTAKWIFSALDGFQNCSYSEALKSALDTYDVILDISSVIQVVALRRETLNHPMHSELTKLIEHIESFNKKSAFFVADMNRMGFLAQKLQFQNVTRATCLHFMAGIPYGGDTFPLWGKQDCISRFGLENKSYVTVHNGFEAQYVASGESSTKCYPHFDQVVTLLKKEFPALTFIQLGSTNSTSIAEVHLNLIGRTSLPEATAIIKGATAHIDNESGLVHIASCFPVPSCVVFGPTPSDYFSYANNTSLRPKSCGGCWWITDDWMDRCPRGFAEPVCTFLQPPQEVAEAMGQLLTRRMAPTTDLIAS